MFKSILAAQLSTVRDHFDSSAELAQTLKKIREIGFEAVQRDVALTIPPEEQRKIADGEGIVYCAAHIPYERLREKTDEVIQELSTIGCKYVAAPELPEAYRRKEGYQQLIKESETFALKFANARIVYCYRNNFNDLEKYERRTALEIVFEGSDPVLLSAELNVYNIQLGGGDPVAWIRRWKGRIPLLHLMDMGVNGNRQIPMEVGEGNMNWAAILNAARDAGVIWYIVGQRETSRDPFDCLAINMRNLCFMRR
jgi:sugar phosphate isomerase/epimerase